MNAKHSVYTNKSRREFLKTTAAAAAAAGITAAMAQPVHAAGDETLKIALVGCGNRGTGAIVQALSTKGPVTLWALADTFDDRLQDCLKHVQREMSEKASDDGQPAAKIDVPKERQFVGLDAYRKPIDACDVVVSTGPPGYRPLHFEYAVNAGKHVFMENPVAPAPAGVRRVLAAAEEAKKKNLKVGVGLQRRHQPGYVEGIQRIQDGALGQIMYQRTFWDMGAARALLPKKPEWSELEYQLRNQFYFAWECGDIIVDMGLHNIDVALWMRGDKDYPVS